MANKLITIAAVLMALYIFIAIVLYFFQEKLIFLPDTLEEDYEYSFNLPFEELWFETPNKGKINALYFPHKKAKGIVLAFHGNSGALDSWGGSARLFNELGYAVLISDYRTYGKSTGPLNEKSIMSDAQYLYDYVNKSWETEDIVVYGRSLGSGPASYVAHKNEVGKLVLETPFYSLTDMAKKRMPILPVNLFLKYKMPNIKYLKKTTCPIHIVHGTKDLIVPVDASERFKQELNDNAQITIIEGGGHNDLHDYEAYHDWIKSAIN